MLHVVIDNKPYINGPEGETIHRDLVIRGGYTSVQSIRSAKMLKMVVTAKTQMEAQSIVKRMCDELRIFNPVVSDCTVKAIGKL